MMHHYNTVAHCFISACFIFLRVRQKEFFIRENMHGREIGFSNPLPTGFDNSFKKQVFFLLAQKKRHGNTITQAEQYRVIHACFNNVVVSPHILYFAICGQPDLPFI